MKTIYKIAFGMLCICGLLLGACTDFEELNTDPSKSSSTDPNQQLSMIQLQTWGHWQMCQPYPFYLAAFAQYMQGDWNTTNYGGQYRKNDAEMGNTWNLMYPALIKNIVDILDKTKDNEREVNIHSVARIYKVYLFSILTDMYGDCPYFEAGKGFITGNVKPAYDKQELIYKDFLKELGEAADALTASGDKVTGRYYLSREYRQMETFCQLPAPALCNAHRKRRSGTGKSRSHQSCRSGSRSDAIGR